MNAYDVTRHSCLARHDWSQQLPDDQWQVVTLLIDQLEIRTRWVAERLRSPLLERPDSVAKETVDSMHEQIAEGAIFVDAIVALGWDSQAIFEFEQARKRLFDARFYEKLDLGDAAAMIGGESPTERARRRRATSGRI